jgi:hypothetical protein
MLHSFHIFRNISKTFHLFFIFRSDKVVKPAEVRKMISNYGYGGMSGYTVYKTNNSESVSIDEGAERPSAMPMTRTAQEITSPRDNMRSTSSYGRDTFDASAASQVRDNNGNKEELQGIRRILEEISAKLSHTPAFQPQQSENNTGASQSRNAGRTREITSGPMHPLMRQDIPSYNQHFNIPFGSSNSNRDGSYNVLQSCKNLNNWAKTEYAQTEGFDTVYSPQELRDRISILGEIENHINSAGAPAVPQMQKNTLITDRNLANYKAMRKDPDRISRRTYFEATV